MDCPLCESQANCEVHDTPKTLGEFAREAVEFGDLGFADFCRGYDLCASPAHQRTSDDPPTRAWLWGHYTDQIPENVEEPT